MDRREVLQSLSSLPMVRQVEVARLQPADTVVITCDVTLSQDAIQRITTQVERAFCGHRCVVLDKGMSLQVVSATGATESTP